MSLQQPPRPSLQSFFEPQLSKKLSGSPNNAALAPSPSFRQPPRPGFSQLRVVVSLPNNTLTTLTSPQQPPRPDLQSYFQPRLISPSPRATAFMPSPSFRQPPPSFETPPRPRVNKFSQLRVDTNPELRKFIHTRRQWATTLTSPQRPPRPDLQSLFQPQLPPPPTPSPPPTPPPPSPLPRPAAFMLEVSFRQTRCPGWFYPGQQSMCAPQLPAV